MEFIDLQDTEDWRRRNSDIHIFCVINRTAKWTHPKPQCLPLKTMCLPTLLKTHPPKAKLHSQVEKGMFWGLHLSLGLLQERAFHVCLYFPMTLESLPCHWVRSVIHIESALTTQPSVLTLICTHLKTIISTGRFPYPRMTSFRKSLLKGNLTKMRAKIS